MNILIVGPAWVGDMVMSQSLYITLKSLYPGATIDVIAPNWCKPILERMPEVNQAITMPIGHGALNILGRLSIAKELKRQNYDHAIVLPNSAKSALIPWFAGIRKRTGWKGEMRYGLLNDLRPNKKDFQYMVERYVALAHPKSAMLNSNSLGGLDNLPKPSLSIDSEVQRQTLDQFSLDTTIPVVGMCPGAEFGPAKKWPSEHYAKVAQTMCEQENAVWLFGSEKDKPTCDEIKQLVAPNLHHLIHVLAGKTSLIEAVDLLAVCKTVVTNDSGLMHVAAATGCNVVAVYGSSSPKYTPPLADNVAYIHTDIECRPCFKKTCKFGHQKCLTELKPQEAIVAIEHLHAKLDTK